MVGCKECPEPEPCPECPETLECPVEYELVKEELKWQCVDTSAPECPPPTNYLDMDRVGEVLNLHANGCGRIYGPGLMRDLCNILSTNAWEGWRNLEYVALNCPDTCKGGSDEVFPLTQSEMLELAEAGKQLNIEGTNWLSKLPQVHRMCNESHECYDEEYCHKSNVSKANWRDFWGRINEHYDYATSLNGCIQSKPCEGEPYDNIRGWCRCRLGQ